MRLLKIILLLLLVAAGAWFFVYGQGKDMLRSVDLMLLVTCFLTQMLFTVGVVVLFAILISLGHNALSRLSGNRARRVYVITGAVGTPIHELGHAIMCVIFRHRIQEMRLYQPNAPDGTLGYVHHSYKRRSIYQQIGNFFIGTAPIFLGSAVLMLLMYLLLPEVFADIMRQIRSSGAILMKNANGTAAVTYFKLFGSFFKQVFDLSNFSNPLWWIFLILAVMVSMHMKLSRADMKGSVGGIFAFAAVLLLADVILSMTSVSVLKRFTTAMIFTSASVVGFLVIALVFSCISVGVALLVSLLPFTARRED